MLCWLSKIEETGVYFFHDATISFTPSLLCQLYFPELGPKPDRRTQVYLTPSFLVTLVQGSLDMGKAEKKREGGRETGHDAQGTK